MTYTAGEGVHCVLGSTHKGRYQFWSSDTQQPDDVKHVHFIIQCQLLHCIVTCAENTAPAHSVSIETTQIKKVTLRLSFRASKLILRSRPELCIGVYNDKSYTDTTRTGPSVLRVFRQSWTCSIILTIILADVGYVFSAQFRNSKILTSSTSWLSWNANSPVSDPYIFVYLTYFSVLIKEFFRVFNVKKRQL